MSAQGETKEAAVRLGGGAIASLFGLAVLVIVVVQNREEVRFDFPVWGFTWPLRLYTIVVALFGALMWPGFGVVRRRGRRKERRESRRD